MGAVGSSCVRDCVRSSHEYTSEDLLVSSVGVSSSSTGSPKKDGPAESFKLGPSLLSPRDGNAMVPPVPNWFQVLQNTNNRSRDAPVETPRFDEVLQSPRTDAPGGSPRSNVGGDMQTPGASPQNSPRPPAEDPAAAKSAQGLYEGTYLGTMKHGTGKLHMTSCIYEGEFLNDFKHGNGILSWDDGRLYQGQFEYAKFHGAAVMTWPDGRKYVGQYAEDRKHGDGIFSWQDGRKYDGQWVGGKRDGIGTYTNAKGLTRRGIWQMDRPLQWDAPYTSPPVSDAAPAVQLVPFGAEQGQLCLPGTVPLGDTATPVPEAAEVNVGPRKSPAVSPASLPISAEPGADTVQPETVPVVTPALPPGSTSAAVAPAPAHDEAPAPTAVGWNQGAKVTDTI